MIRNQALKAGPFRLTKNEPITVELGPNYGNATGWGAGRMAALRSRDWEKLWTSLQGHISVGSWQQIGARVWPAPMVIPVGPLTAFPGITARPCCVMGTGCQFSQRIPLSMKQRTRQVMLTLLTKPTRTRNSSFQYVGAIIHHFFTLHYLIPLSTYFRPLDARSILDE